MPENLICVTMLTRMCVYKFIHKPRGFGKERHRQQEALK